MTESREAGEPITSKRASALSRGEPPGRASKMSGVGRESVVALALIWMVRIHCRQTKGALVLLGLKRDVEVLVSRAVRAALTRGDWPRIVGGIAMADVY